MVERGYEHPLEPLRSQLEGSLTAVRRDGAWRAMVLQRKQADRGSLEPWLIAPENTLTTAYLRPSAASHTRSRSATPRSQRWRRHGCDPRSVLERPPGCHRSRPSRAEPARASTPRAPLSQKPPLLGQKSLFQRVDYAPGGGNRIRTCVRVTPQADYQSAAFNHSATPVVPIHALNMTFRATHKRATPQGARRLSKAPTFRTKIAVPNVLTFARRGSPWLGFRSFLHLAKDSPIFPSQWS